MKTPAASIEEMNGVLADTPFLNPYGFTVKACAPGECTVLVPFMRSLERPGGRVSGMILMGAADVAMWLAIMTLRGTAERWVTSDMKTAFLRGAREEDILCTARVLKPGKRSMYGTAECHGAASGMVAHHVLTYAKVEA
ncbi:MAG: PaaI family thioesterase [Deltaproteobacteria bacterium]|nr:PaaI family thioesterase [Deltaproteobacteria bacterium]